MSEPSPLTSEAKNPSKPKKANSELAPLLPDFSDPKYYEIRSNGIVREIPAEPASPTPAPPAPAPPPPPPPPPPPAPC